MTGLAQPAESGKSSLKSGMVKNKGDDHVKRSSPLLYMYGILILIPALDLDVID